MTIDKIKKRINRNIGKDVKIICKGSRNKREVFNGKINATYNFIFTIKSNNNLIKSFSYSDILTENVKIFNNKKVTK